MRKTWCADIVEKCSNGAGLVMRKMPNHMGDDETVVKARVSKTWVVKFGVVATAKISDMFDALERGRGQISINKTGIFCVNENL